MNSTQQQTLEQWAKEQALALLNDRDATLELTMVSGDASFRRYFRLQGKEESFIVVDAPPAHENNRQFVAVARMLRDAGLVAPAVYAVDYDLGFLLLQDLGDQLYLGYLLECQQQNLQNDIDNLYRRAISSLVAMQQKVDKKRLAPYSREDLHSEMRLFDEWFCQGLLGLPLDKQTRNMISDTYRMLEDSALSQAQVAVHRDYHSRNLMILDPDHFGTDAGPGILDFQDAVCGPCTYDLVSLLRDCYISWPEQQLQQWVRYYFELAAKAGIVGSNQTESLLRDFDLMGLQRHIKVMGIFSRLSLRDKKSGYLADIPVVIRYFLEVAARHEEMTEFLEWFNTTVLPLAADKLELDSD